MKFEAIETNRFTGAEKVVKTGKSFSEIAEEVVYNDRDVRINGIRVDYEMQGSLITGFLKRNPKVAYNLEMLEMTRAAELEAGWPSL